MQTTTTIQKNNFHLLTISVPSVNSNKTGFKSAIVSSVCLNKLTIDKTSFLQRMNSLNLRNMTLVIIDDTVNEVTKQVFNEQFGSEQFGIINCNITIIFLNINEFFSLDTFEFFFSKQKEKNFETIYAFRGLS